MKKIWIKRIGIGLIGLAVGVFVLHLGLHIISGTSWLHQKISDQIASATGCEVKLGHARFNLRGARIKDFALARPGLMSEGKMLHVKRAQVKLSLWHLIHGELHIKAVDVDGLSFHLVRDEQGKLNTDFSNGETTPANSEESSSAPFDIAIKELSARQISLIYEDKKTSLQTELKNLEINVRNFSWDEPFDVHAKTTFLYTQNEDKFSANLSLAANVFLSELDLSKAYADISSFAVHADDLRAVLSGRVEKWDNPAFKLKLTGKNVSSETLAPFVSQDFPFIFASLSANAEGNVQPEKEKVELQQAEITFPGVNITGQGNAQWARNEYNLTANAKVQVDTLEDTFPTLKPYDLGGNITLKTQLTPNKLTTKGAWLAGKLHVPQMGNISALQVMLDGDEQWDFTSGKGSLDINGVLNDDPFKILFSFDQTPKKITTNLKASADRVALPKTDKKAEQKTAAPDSATTEKKPWSLPPITAHADVQIMSLDAPYLRGDDLNFKLDMSGITPRLDQAHGTLNLSIADGQIIDLYQLTNSNAVMKVLFMSLNVVGKVFNSLDVLSVLGGLTSSAKQDEKDEVIKMIPNENGEMVAVRVPASSRKVDGKLAYDKFVTDVQFDTGVATVKQGSFVSDMMSFNVSGKTDFKTEKIDMTVHAAPGKHETTGIMPLTLKIGGTVSNPQGNMSVLGSVTSLVTQGVANNFASRAVKKGVGGVVGLFTKDAPQEETPSPEETPAPEETATPEETAAPQQAASEESAPQQAE